jgi:hypothetical protein
MKIDNALEVIDRKKQLLLLQEAFLRKEADFIESLECTPSIWNENIDFDYPSHADAIKIIRHFGGRWNKSYLANRVNYTQIADGMTLRLYEGEPPPSCRIVEEMVDVPETVIPARRELVKKLVCREEKVSPSEVGTRRITGVNE